MDTSARPVAKDDWNQVLSSTNQATFVIRTYLHRQKKKKKTVLQNPGAKIAGSKMVGSGMDKNRNG